MDSSDVSAFHGDERAMGGKQDLVHCNHFDYSFNFRSPSPWHCTSHILVLQNSLRIYCISHQQFIMKCHFPWAASKKQEQTQPDMSWNSQLNSCSAASNYPLESVEMYFLTFWKLYILYVLESATCTMTACTLHQENGDKEQNDLKVISSTSNVVGVPKYTYLSEIQIWKAYRATNKQIVPGGVQRERTKLKVWSSDST